MVSKLATYPQPLLKAVLLHPDVVVQPACSTLIQAICEYEGRHEIKSKSHNTLSEHELLGAAIRLPGAATATQAEHGAAGVGAHHRDNTGRGSVRVPAVLVSFN